MEKINPGKTDPLKRIAVAEHTYDMGEYLADLLSKGELSTDFGRIQRRIIYYPPCHLREQGIGTPYVELLRMIPGINVEAIEGPFYCCGLGGYYGIQKGFSRIFSSVGGRPDGKNA
jgi:glycerol-3-phosphate dehydrogenase subunit C